MKEAVIVSAVRSAIGKAHKGSLVNMRIDDLGALVVREAIQRVPGLKVEEIEDVIIGCAMPEGEQGLNVARLISFLARIPVTAAGTTVNRFCGSSLQAINFAAQAIMTGNGDVFVAGGIESMSHVPMRGFNPSLNEKLMGEDYPDAYISMGMTAENLAEKYHIPREEQDEFAFLSHQKAIRAIQAGQFKQEIVPVEVTLSDGTLRIFDTDESPRLDTSLSKLAALEPAFKQGGTVTAGNSSPLSDGAAAVILMSRDKARELGIKPLAVIRAMAVAGVDPTIMGIGPVPAVQKALKRAGLKLEDMDVIELNEAFAAQAIAVIRELKIDLKKLNPRGGAIAIGHPLGATGARIMATLVHEMQDRGARFGLETMCIGGGQGIATILERED
jgi:acetyl-CoA acetyltransferase family protein